MRKGRGRNDGRGKGQGSVPVATYFFFPTFIPGCIVVVINNSWSCHMLLIYCLFEDIGVAGGDAKITRASVE